MGSWVDKAVVLAIHDEQIAEHGGLPGLRDDNALESALARPRQLLACDAPTIIDLAAAYAIGLARNHAFTDGNKRVSAVVTELFLGLNGVQLSVDDAAIVTTWIAIASGQMQEAALARWLADNSVEAP